MDRIIFFVKNESGLAISDQERERQINKVLKITGKKSQNNGKNRTALFQTYDDKTGIDLIIKRQINSGHAELYNIATQGDIDEIVSETIRYIKKYMTSERTIVIFIESREFIVEFAKRYFDRRLDYFPATDHEKVKVLDCITFRLR